MEEYTLCALPTKTLWRSRVQTSFGHSRLVAIFSKWRKYYIWETNHICLLISNWDTVDDLNVEEEGTSSSLNLNCINNSFSLISNSFNFNKFFQADEKEIIETTKLETRFY